MPSRRSACASSSSSDMGTKVLSESDPASCTLTPVSFIVDSVKNDSIHVIAFRMKIGQLTMTFLGAVVCRRRSSD